MNKVEADGKKRVVDDATYWQVADKSLRHERLQDVIRTVKCHVDLMLNNQFDALINQEIGGEEFEEADHRSCPDLHPDFAVKVACKDLIKNIPESQISPISTVFNNLFD